LHDDDQNTENDREAARRDSQETWDAFIIVMGVSLFPLIFASVGVLLVHFRVINISDYDPNATTVKGIGRGIFTITWFGIAGLVVPMLYAIHVFFRTRRERRADKLSGGGSASDVHRPNGATESSPG
jgi:hypothetical protein